MKKSSKQPMTLDDLAVMIKRGFDNTDEQFEIVRTDIEQLKRGQTKLESGQARLERGQEDLKLELDQMAPNFEVTDLSAELGELNASSR